MTYSVFNLFVGELYYIEKDLNTFLGKETNKKIIFIKEECEGIKYGRDVLTDEIYYFFKQNNINIHYEVLDKSVDSCMLLSYQSIINFIDFPNKTKLNKKELIELLEELNKPQLEQKKHIQKKLYKKD